MDSYSWPVPNGKYVVKLHFAETFEGSPGQVSACFRLTSRAKSSRTLTRGQGRWVFEGLRGNGPVEVTDGKIKVTFTPKVENPQICAIEIIPQSGSETSAVTPAPAPPPRRARCNHASGRGNCRSCACCNHACRPSRSAN